MGLEKINVPKGNKAILCLDGGGIRGIMTLQLLKKLEEVCGEPCHKLFDMVAGTSTGGIIAGLIAAGNSAEQIEELYIELVDKVFKSNGIFHSKFTNPPAYTKSNYRARLKTLVGDNTLADVCKSADIDLMITAKDVAEGEETFFSCFLKNNQACGTYKDVLLRAVMEATMSAPTYFNPLERFVDGGVTTYNNPSIAAILEAVEYGPKNKYNPEKLTVMSFGTGYRNQLVAPEEVADPPGPDILFWLSWLMAESGADASDMQSDILRCKKFFPKLDYRRFQCSLDHAALTAESNGVTVPDVQIENIHVTNANWTSELTDKELSDIDLDNTAYFRVMQAIGKAFVGYVELEANRRNMPMFSFDFINDQGKELMVTRQGAVSRIRNQMSKSAWLDDVKP